VLILINKKLIAGKTLILYNIHIMYPRKASSKGFTLVELLIVIVVIAVIASITVLAYNNIQARARAASAQAAIHQAMTKIQTFTVDNDGNYPSNLAAIGITDTSSTTYQYNVNNSASPRTFCVAASVSGASYYVSQDVPTPTAGTCSVTSSIFGSTYPYTATLWTDGAGSLKVATVFYSYNNSFTVKGGKVYLPSVPPGVSLTIFYVLGFYSGGTFSSITWSQVPSGIPNQYATIPNGSLVTGWNTVTFPTPATVNPYSAGVDGTSVWIGYYFSDGNDYVFTTSPKASAIVSSSNSNLFIAETGFEGKDRSANNAGGGGWSQALYGIDIVTAGP
jgi:prepilin-type N-terminal cleavage/methylation domain-containing protein